MGDRDNDDPPRSEAAVTLAVVYVDARGCARGANKAVGDGTALTVGSGTVSMAVITIKLFEFIRVRVRDAVIVREGK